jgi:selenocysteine-specific elongation factor
LPEQRRVRVRGLQTHGRKVTRAEAGQRTAVNLAGIEHSELERGMVLAEPRVHRPSQILDAKVEMLADAPRGLRSRQRIRIHLGTAEVLARVFVLNEESEIVPGKTGFVQLRLESPIASAIADRFIIRSYSPQRTIGGGEVLVPNADKHKRRDIAPAVQFLGSLVRSSAEPHAIADLLINASKEQGLDIADLCEFTGWTKNVAEAALSKTAAVKAGGRYIAPDQFTAISENIFRGVEAFHKKDQFAAGMSREMLRETGARHVPVSIFETVLERLEDEGKLVAEKELIRLSGHLAELSSDEAAVSAAIVASLAGSRYEPPKISEVVSGALAGTRVGQSTGQKLIKLLAASGEIIKVTDEFYFAAAAIAELKTDLKAFANGTPDRVIDVAKFKEIAGVSRKYAIPLLEYFDRERITVRAGDKRVILK